jgi:SAM-dependent methyltransferase
MKSILEVGSLDVNGSLKDFRPKGAEWVGVDLEAGKGVDIVVEKSAPLPFEEKSFDLVVATSIFEHDPMFWATFNEMLRVTKDGGFIFVSAPSNGWVHRYPLDVYRFYPDAGVALQEWGVKSRANLRLQESFISERDGEVWNDFIAVFSLGEESQLNKIYLDTPSTNVWRESEFLVDTLSEKTEDMRLNDKLRNENLLLKEKLENAIELEEFEKVVKENDILRKEHKELMDSKSWKITSPLRKVASMVGKLRR